MDLHPILVHFPIALLTIYSLLELATTKRLTKLSEWLWIKFTLLAAGVIISPLTLASGEAAAETIEHSSLSRLVETHSAVATTTVFIYTAILIIYLLSFANKYQLKLPQIKPLNRTISILGRLYNIQILLRLLSLIGLIAIFITGALGGALVYGPSTEPLSTYFFNLLTR